MNWDKVGRYLYACNLVFLVILQYQILQLNDHIRDVQRFNNLLTPLICESAPEFELCE